MKKESLTPQQTKTNFIKSIHNWLMATLEQRGKEEFKECFKIDGSSIMCRLPSCYFALYDIPEDTVIEMKFIVKKTK